MPHEESPFSIADPARAHARAEPAFRRGRADLAALLAPVNPDIQHIGATAVPGALTKGDLDILVRVSAADFARAEALLLTRLAPNQGSDRSAELASFVAPGSDPPLGVQLVAIGGSADTFHLFRDALRASPALLDRYNELKRAMNGRTMAEYREAKSAFIESVVRGADQRPVHRASPGADGFTPSG